MMLLLAHIVQKSAMMLNVLKNLNAVQIVMVTTRRILAPSLFGTVKKKFLL